MANIEGYVVKPKTIEGEVAKTRSVEGEVKTLIGLTPEIEVGTTTTLETGEEAYVELDSKSTKTKPIFNFGLPKGTPGKDGDKGETGNSGVYVGSEAPTDEGVNVWIDPAGDTSEYAKKEYVDELIGSINAELATLTEVE